MSKIISHATVSSKALLCTGSVALLVKLGASQGSSWVTWQSLGAFRNPMRIGEGELEPLVLAGWVDSRVGSNNALSVRITDAGNEKLRGLVAWLQEAAGKEAA
jgi:hypothetical protein